MWSGLDPLRLHNGTNFCDGHHFSSRLPFAYIKYIVQNWETLLYLLYLTYIHSNCWLAVSNNSRFVSSEGPQVAFASFAFLANHISETGILSNLTCVLYKGHSQTYSTALATSKILPFISLRAVSKIRWPRTSTSNSSHSITTKKARQRLLHQMSTYIKLQRSKVKLSIKGDLKVCNITVFWRNSTSAMFSSFTSLQHALRILLSSHNSKPY
jgi:hypothetical protein